MAKNTTKKNIADIITQSMRANLTLHARGNERRDVELEAATFAGRVACHGRDRRNCARTNRVQHGADSYPARQRCDRCTRGENEPDNGEVRPSLPTAASHGLAVDVLAGLPET
ncbi:hypothetical protein [Microbacterium sp. K35]|uniref:hypothetical protein n=1 Tax=Microbacterium sp. K35 TaxID=2305440 RepID=UPI00109BE2D8|nr:hypothetical protein [Microbacterium sp. K35]